MNKLKVLVDRFKEPSSWAGIAALLTLLAPQVGIAVGQIPVIVQAGVGVAGVLAIVLAEKGINTKDGDAKDDK